MYEVREEWARHLVLVLVLVLDKVFVLFCFVFTLLCFNLLLKGLLTIQDKMFKRHVDIQVGV